MLLKLAAAVLQVVVATSGMGPVADAPLEPQASCTTYLWTCTTQDEVDLATHLRIEFEGPGLFPPGVDAVVFLYDENGRQLASEVCTNFELATPLDDQSVGCAFPLAEPVSGPVRLSLDVWGTYAGHVTAQVQ